MMSISSLFVSPIALRKRNLFAQEKGQGLIEVALALPVYFFMLFGFINFSLVIYELSNLTFASHAAVRYACLHSTATAAPATPSSITAYIHPFISSYPQNTCSVAVTYPSTGSNTIGGTVQIVVTVTYTLNLFGHAVNNLTATSTSQGVILI